MFGRKNLRSKYVGLPKTWSKKNFVKQMFLSKKTVVPKELGWMSKESLYSKKLLVQKMVGVIDFRVKKNLGWKKEHSDQKTYLEKVNGSGPKPGGHFGFLRFSQKKWSNKETYLRKLIGGSKNLRFNLFPDPVGHFGLSRRLGVAGGSALQAVSECPRSR